MVAMILQVLISGVAMGFIYALVGIEYTLVWNVTGLMNFAHDKFITLGAYIFVALLVRALGLPLYISVVLAVVIMYFFGKIAATGLFTPLSHLSPIYAITGTVMLGRIIYEAVRLIWGVNPITVLEWLSGTIHVQGFVITEANVAIIIASIIIVCALQLFLQKTKTGTAMRCVAENKTATALMGINVGKSTALTLGISSAICCIIGLLITPLYNVSGTMASSIVTKGFASGVIGGFGYLPGTIAGGIFLGVLEALSVLVIPAVYKDCVSFILMILFLVFQPKGLLGKGQ